MIPSQQTIIKQLQNYCVLLNAAIILLNRDMNIIFECLFNIFSFTYYIIADRIEINIYIYIYIIIVRKILRLSKEFISFMTTSDINIKKYAYF